jgi:hypothetical protein
MLVSSRTHAQSEEENLIDEDVEAEGRNDREGEGRALQHHSTNHPDEARMEGEIEDQHTNVTPCVMKILIKLLKL